MLNSRIFLLAAAAFTSAIMIFSVSGGKGAGEPVLSGQVLGASEFAIEADGSLPLAEEKPAPLAAPALPAFAPGPPPELSARSGLLLDSVSGGVLYERLADESRPIASLTKLMTALVFLDHNPGWEAIYGITPADITSGGRSHVYAGEKIYIKDLFSLSLAASDNTAARALVGASGLEESEFIAAMNEKAAALGLSETAFADPVGLHNKNISTAREIAGLLGAALANDRLRAASLLKKYEFKTLAGRPVLAHSTDALLDDFSENGIALAGGKTGYTGAAGYCFAGEFIDRSGRRLISVVLGAPDRRASFDDTRSLALWAHENHRLNVVFPAGE